MIRTNAEIETLAANGSPSDIVDAMDAYEDHIRYKEHQITQLKKALVAATKKLNILKAKQENKPKEGAK